MLAQGMLRRYLGASARNARPMVSSGDGRPSRFEGPAGFYSVVVLPFDPQHGPTRIAMIGELLCGSPS